MSAHVYVGAAADIVAAAVATVADNTDAVGRSTATHAGCRPLTPFPRQTPVAVVVVASVDVFCSD